MDLARKLSFLDVTPAQIRAARALLGWSRNQLAAACGVTVRTLDRLEAGKKEPSRRTAMAVRAALEDAGIAFIPQDGGGPGVRLREAVAPDGPTPPPSFSATIGTALDAMPGKAAGGPQDPRPREVHPEDEVRGGEEALK
ncbi:MAG TPA: helix-turn-helix transcriptional regulator [Roseomonas sp.]|nr:helix-turn-helix transcriptional regulator [Roseomonas sp.]